MSNSEQSFPFLHKRLTRRRFIQGLGTATLGTVTAATIGCGGDNTNSNNENGLSSPKPEVTPTQILHKELNPAEINISIDNLPNEKDEVAIGNAIPSRMVIRQGSILQPLGIYEGTDGVKNIIMKISDPKRKNEDGTTQQFIVCLPDSFSLSQKKETDVSFEDLIKINNGDYDSKLNLLSLEDGTKGTLPSLTSDDAAKYKSEAGIFFIDRDPLKKGDQLHLSPVIRSGNDSSVFPEGSVVAQVEDGKIVSKDATGKIIARAISRRGGEWSWTKKEYLLNDYSPSELAEALGFTIAVYGLAHKLNDSRYTEEYVQSATKLKIGAEITNKQQFNNNIDWRKILDNWDFVQDEFKKGNIPYQDNLFNSTGVNKVQQLLSFAKQNNLPVVSGGALFHHGDIIDAIYSNAYSIDEKKKMIEFMGKARLLKYKDSIKEWAGAAELAGGELWVGEPFKTLYNNLGGRDFVHDVFTWAKEVHPEVKLGYVEGNVLDSNYDVVRRQEQTFFEILAYLKQKGTPIYNAGFENNFWVYAPPSKDIMIRDLQKIKDMGLEVFSAETTIALSDSFPLNKQRPRTVQAITDKLAAQATICEDTIMAYIQTGGEFGLFSGTDANNWLLNTYGDTEAKPEIFDTNYQPKPAYFAMVKSLHNAVRARLAA